MEESKTREKLTVSRDEAHDIALGYSEDFKVIVTEVVETCRWTILYEVVVQRISDGAFFSSSYNKGATEYQDQSAYEYDEPVFNQVFPKEKTIIVYE